jgi:hypothetical protein
MARDFIPYTVYDRYKLFPNAKLKGPAIIEEKESTVIVGEDASVAVDDFGFLWIDILNSAGPVSLRRGQGRRSVSARTRRKTSARGKSKR